MTSLPRITDATPLHDRWIRLRFSDGVVQEVDLAPVLADGQLFAAIRDDDNVFTQVQVNDESGTIDGRAESISTPTSSTDRSSRKSAVRSSAGSSSPSRSWRAERPPQK
jgi:Protein of unknown function (DUF2442)